MDANLFALPIPEMGERFETLLTHHGCRIEAIVSSETPEPTLYNQPHDEAVLLISGTATLEMAGKRIVMQPGDFLMIPAHTPHRVMQVEHGTRWFAIHFDSIPSETP
jgi:cupin 2 domain-containing protein